MTWFGSGCRIEGERAFGVRRAAILAILFAVTFAGWADSGDQADTRPPEPDHEGLLRIDTTFFEMAAATGGDFHFWAPGEFARAPLDIAIEDEPVLLAYGALDEATRFFEIPVDDGTGTMSVFAGAQRKDRFVLLRPGGEPASASDADVRVQEREHQILVTLVSPEVGLWRLELSGRGRFGAAARMSEGPPGASPDARRDAVTLLGFELVELAGRPGHEGLFPVRGPVRAGDTHTCQIRLAGPWESIEAAFVAPDATVLVPVEVQRDETDRREALGRCRVPDEPFRVRIRGRTRAGAVFQRFDSPLRVPAPAVDREE